MIYIVYILLAPLNRLMSILGRLLSPILPLFAGNAYGWVDNGYRMDFGPRLPRWLNWFQSWDNDLYGDSTFIKINGKSYLSQVKWLFRNPAPSVGLRTLNAPYNMTFSGDKNIKDNDNAKEGHLLIKGNGCFQYVLVKRIFSSSRCWYFNFGWNIRMLVDDNVPNKPDSYQATFVFSPRTSGFR